MKFLRKLFGKGEKPRREVTEEKHLDQNTKQEIYADFSQSRKAEEDKIFDLKRAVQDRVRAGENPFFAMGAAYANFRQSPEAKRVYESTLTRIAAKHRIGRDQLLRIIAEGEEKGWET